jgi:hypothetical protein
MKQTLSVPHLKIEVKDPHNPMQLREAIEKALRDKVPASSPHLHRLKEAAQSIAQNIAQSPKGGS